MSVEIPTTMIPPGSAVSLKIEVMTQFNISAAVAKQKANRFLAMNAGNMLAAGDPELIVGATLHWRVPVLFGTPAKGMRGRVGELIVDADTGEVVGVVVPQLCRKVAPVSSFTFYPSRLKTCQSPVNESVSRLLASCTLHRHYTMRLDSVFVL